MKMLFVSSAVTLSACLPQKPGAAVVVSMQKMGVLELYQMNKETFVFPPPGEGDEPIRKAVLSHRNLLLVATDDEIQQRFAEPIRAAYHSAEPIRLEDLSWWLFAPEIRPLYDQVVRIPYDQLKKETLFQALEYLESLNTTYDVFLLTHGVPNNIEASKGFGLITWKDIDELQNRLPHLNLLFDQGCFGDSMVADWEQAGAKINISYPGLNQNFFYLPFFLKNYDKFAGDATRAFEKTNAEIMDQIAGSRLYRTIINVMGMSLEEYFDLAPNPHITKR